MGFDIVTVLEFQSVGIQYIFTSQFYYSNQKISKYIVSLFDVESSNIKNNFKRGNLKSFLGSLMRIFGSKMILALFLTSLSKKILENSISKIYIDFLKTSYSIVKYLPKKYELYLKSKLNK